MACRAYTRYSQWPGIADVYVLALRLAPCARSFDAAGKLTQRREGEESGMACRAISDSQWPGIADVWVLALRSAPGARSFDAAGKLTQRRKSAKKQVWLAEPYSDSQWPGIADVWVLALRFAPWRGPLMLRESSRKGGGENQVWLAELLGFAVAWYSGFGPGFAPWREVL